MAADAPIVQVALDAHYYSGGLRVRRLGQDASWTPIPPERFAGFRDEVPLDGHDQVVEVARLEIERHQLWWIAIYRRSTDDQLPDRGNHAGVGVWVRDGEVREPLLLLHGLRQLTAKLVEDGPDNADQVARRFLLPEHLPQYVRPRTPMPAQLCGWHRAGGPPQPTARYVTDAQPEGREWELIADQIGRMAFLPAPAGEFSRAVVLIRAPGSTASAGSLEVLQADFARKLSSVLPDVLSGVAVENGALRAQAEGHEAQAVAWRADLQNLRSGEAAAHARISELETQLEASDPSGRLRAIEATLTKVDAQARGNGEVLTQVRQDLRDMRAAVNQSGTSWRNAGQRISPPAANSVPPMPERQVEDGLAIARTGLGLHREQSTSNGSGGGIARAGDQAGARAMSPSARQSRSAGVDYRMQLLIGAVGAVLLILIVAIYLWLHRTPATVAATAHRPASTHSAPDTGVQSEDSATDDVVQVTPSGDTTADPQRTAVYPDSSPSPPDYQPNPDRPSRSTPQSDPR